MGQDVDSGSREAGGTSGSAPRRSSSAAAARLLGALQSRPGHALVVAESAEAAETFFAQVDAELVCYRRIRVTGAGLDAEAVVRALGADVVERSSLHAIVAALATRARAAKAPILVVVARAEEAGPTALERLGASFASVPEAHGVVQLVLLGGPALAAVLAQPEARRLAGRLETTVDLSHASPAADEAPTAAQASGAPRRARAALGVALLLAAVPLIVRWAVRSTPPAAVPTAAEPPVERAPEPPPPATAAVPPSEAAEPAAPADAEPPPEAPAPPMPHATSLQVGAFGELRNAEALRARLARLYPDVVVVPIDRDGVRLHCVRLGGLASEREVTARLAALRAAGYSPIRVRD